MQEGVSAGKGLMRVQDELVGDVFPWAGEGARVALDAEFKVIGGELANDAKEHVRGRGLLDEEVFDFKMNESLVRKRGVRSAALGIFPEQAKPVLVDVEIRVVWRESESCGPRGKAAGILVARTSSLGNAGAPIGWVAMVGVRVGIDQSEGKAIAIGC